MASLERAAEVVLKKCMKLKEFESCLIITDENKLKIANVFLKEAGKITKNVKLVQIPVGNETLILVQYFPEGQTQQPAQ